MVRIILLPSLTQQVADQTCQITASEKKIKLRFLAIIVAKKVITSELKSNSRKI